MTSLIMTVLSITSEAHLIMTGVRVVWNVEMWFGGRRQMTSLTITDLSITSETHLTVTSVRVVWIVEMW